MKARVYTLVITTDIIHDWKAQIKEIYIPSMKISFNNYEQVNIFKTYKGRYTDATLVEEIEIDDTFAERLFDNIYERLLLEEKVEKFMTKVGL